MDLTNDFHKDMVEIYNEVLKQTGYRANRFIQMVSEEGGYVTAKKLINKSEGSEGYVKLLELNRLDLTVEYLIINGKDGEYQKLFTFDEIRMCKSKL